MLANYGTAGQAAQQAAGPRLQGMSVGEQIETLDALGTELGNAYGIIAKLQVKADAYDVLAAAVRQGEELAGGRETPQISTNLPQMVRQRAEELRQDRTAWRQAQSDASEKAWQEQLARDAAELEAAAVAEKKRKATARKRAATLAAKAREQAEPTTVPVVQPKPLVSAGGQRVLRRRTPKPRGDAMDKALGAALTSNLLDEQAVARAEL